MVSVTLQLDPAVAGFYTRIAAVNQLPLETVLQDALFKLAAELSLEAMRQKILSDPKNTPKNQDS